MSDVLDQSFEQGPAKRPVFITVLCILTFVSCGLAFMSSIYGLVTAGKQKESMRMIQRLQSQNDMPEMFEKMQGGLVKMQDWTVFGHYLALGNVILCLIGALLMWRLRKMGYFIYIGGQILPFITLFGMYSVVKDVPFLGFGMIITAVFTALFAIAFIIMYGVNLKHMR